MSAAEGPALGPDFFIVGAPKSGTTALSTYLGAHPEIFMAPKEQHYFGSDLVLTSPPRPTAAQYFGSFAGSEAAHRRGEASVWYLYSERAAEEIHAYNPRARIIVMLRHPVDMMHALHSQFLYATNEDIADFGEALAAEADRREGRRIPPTSAYPWGLQYRRVARYGEQIERYREAFGDDQLHVILFDDFESDPRGAYRRVLELLEVDASFTPEMPVVNANRRVRSMWLRELGISPPKSVRAVARVVIPSSHVRSEVRRRGSLAIKRYNTKVVPRPPIDPALREQLEAELAEEIRAMRRYALDAQAASAGAKLASGSAEPVL